MMIDGRVIVAFDWRIYRSNEVSHASKDIL